MTQTVTLQSKGPHKGYLRSIGAFDNAQVRRLIEAEKYLDYN